MAESQRMQNGGRLEEWVGLSPGADRGSGIMRNRPFEAVSSDRGLLGMRGMRERPRSRDSGSSGRLRMVCEPSRAGGPAPAPLQVPAVKEPDVPSIAAGSATPPAWHGCRAEPAPRMPPQAAHWHSGPPSAKKSLKPSGDKLYCALALSWEECQG